MGVDTQTWRARIGAHVSSGVRLHCSSANGDTYFTLGFVVLNVLTLSALLLIGCIESNPGPNYQCSVCMGKPLFGTISEEVLHQKSHALDKNFSPTCPVCSLQFGTWNALNVHVHVYHGESRNLPLQPCPQTCNVATCSKVFPSTKLLCQHLKKDHLKSGEKVLCPFKDVCKSSNLFSGNSFAVHLSQKHMGWNLSFPTTVNDQEFNPGTNATLEIGDDSNDGNVTPETHDGDVLLENSLNGDDMSVDFSPDPQEEKLIQWREEFFRHLAMFYLRLESLHLIPISTINVIAQSIADLTATNMAIMKEAILKEFDDLNLTEDVKNKKLNSILSTDNLFAAHHKDVSGPDFSTDSLRKSYYFSHFDYIEPLAINLSLDVNNPRCVYYCKIEETLNLFLKNNHVRKLVEASFERQSSEGTFQDYQDGTVHKKRKLNHPEKSIDLFLFTDEFTPTKDLSSVSNLYKILGMYYTIGNLPPHFRAKLDSKRLVMLVPDSKAMLSDFKVKLFDTVTKELKKLETNGILFMDEQVKVRLRFLLGDNKGQHEIGGFIQSFSSEYFCRFCPMTKTEINEEPWKVGPLRTPESYEEASRMVRPDRATFMGVATPEWSCPFNKLEDFHACDPGLVSCIGHDLFLGVINYDLAAIIRHFVHKKWFTYPQLNRLISKFKLNGKDSANRPAPVKYEKKKDKKEKKDRTLGGHAVQNWTLLRLLPFILDKTFVKDCNDAYWKLYLSLKELTERLCAPSATLSEVGCLKVMTEDYMLERQSLLGDGKPKHHLVAHVADFFTLIGPIVHFSGLGFEQVHQFFKSAAKAGKNFVNLGKRLANKYCLYLTYLSASSPFILGVKILTPGISVSMQRNIEIEEDFEAALQSKNISDEALLMPKIEVDGLLFKENQWFLLEKLNDTEVEVGMIVSTVLDENRVYFVLKKHISTYVPDYGIYYIHEDSSGMACIPRIDMRYPSPHSIYEWGDYERCFSLKHALADPVIL